MATFPLRFKIPFPHGAGRAASGGVVLASMAFGSTNAAC